MPTSREVISTGRTTWKQVGRLSEGAVRSHAYLIDQYHLRRLLIYSALAGASISLAFPVLTNLWVFFGLLFLVGIATAPFWPSIMSYCGDQLPGTDTTMLFVLLSCAGVPGCGVFAWLMGSSATTTGSAGRSILSRPTFSYWRHSSASTGSSRPDPRPIPPGGGLEPTRSPAHRGPSGGRLALHASDNTHLTSSRRAYYD